jgi:mannose-6-phosphate isomerase
MTTTQSTDPGPGAPDRPVPIAANLPPTFYRGAGRIAAFRHDSTVDATRPEDWIASATARFGDAPHGLTTLSDGSTLADRIAADPAGWLGPEHVLRHGVRDGLLVKLLDAGQRLPLHLHPDRTFAHDHLSSPYGKTEAWIVLQAEPDAAVHFGFSRTVEPGELDDWVTRQDVEAMLGATNRIPVAAGDVWLCPAGVPHAVGDGILCLELQEPTDFSIMLETAGFPIDPASSLLGLDAATAMRAVRRDAVDRTDLDRWRGVALDTLDGTGLAGAPRGLARQQLMPSAADEFFTAEQLRPADGETMEIDQRYALLVVHQGSGALRSRTGWSVDLTAGQTWLVPFAAGPLELSGRISVLRCCAG